MGIEFGREICGNLQNSESREWLVTNGIGGYASGTVAGLLTRRYHGLLIAALNPPLGRTLMLTKLDETALYDDQTYPLYTNRWVDIAIRSQGYLHLESFCLEGVVPVWRFACADAILEKRVWMQQGANTTYIQYVLIRATKPLTITLKALVNYRDHHGDTHTRLSDWKTTIGRVEQGLCVTAFPGATPLYLLANATTILPAHEWYENFDLAVERSRGLCDREDHLHAATFEITLNPGKEFTFVASTEPTTPSLDGLESLAIRHAHSRELLALWKANRAQSSMAAPNWIKHLVLAADQFIVERPLENETNGKTVIAGYPWFGDWGRDTMISLPGLTLATGRFDIAQSILQTFARYVNQGMLPNRFPDAGEIPEYNTVDATLWYFEAIRAYYAATGDDDLLQNLFPALADIIDWHCRGTRHNICLDAADGLLYAGETGVQLTWMDAKVNDWVVTPRIGKPIEINALWYNALQTIATFARRLGKPYQEYEAIAQLTQSCFSRFWNSGTGYCYDVLDGPEGDDDALRPNQLFAVVLPQEEPPRFSALLTSAQQRAIVEVCGRKLLTSHGLRSLSPHHSEYLGHYGGNQRQRDGAYHQGTVWGWLIGPFVQAHLKVYRNPAQARQLLEPMANHLTAHGIGSLSEIFDGDAPMTPRGCIAQAWTVAEVLKAWHMTENANLSS
jgi:predicted glycogen debranching enzyme